MKVFSGLAPWIILLASFAVLAYFYESLPERVLITRSVDAPKSLFTVFRVPLIETVCALAISVMRRKFKGEEAADSPMWLILLYGVSLKSLFQSFELVSSRDYADVFFYVTVGIVSVTVAAALLSGRRVLSAYATGDRYLSRAEITVMMLLLTAYIGLALVPMLIFS
jgi:hypothetical protein